MIDFIIFASFVAIVAILLIIIMNLALKNRRLAVELLQSTMDHNIILTKFAEELKKKEDVSVEKTDGFLKFISESRDMAFQYIEAVQAALATFKSKVEPKLKYSNTYGTATGPTAHTKVLEEISLAYEELKKIMPEDNLKEDKAK